MSEPRKLGRPSAYPGGSYKAVRLPDHLVEMISWIAKIDGVTAAEVIVPLVGDAITARYEKIKPFIQKIIEAEQAAKLAAEESQRKAERLLDLKRKVGKTDRA